MSHISVRQDRESYLNYLRQWRVNNPRTFTQDLDLSIAMNRVKKRDNNTCQWYKCGLSHKDTQIHVHHIFPQKDYPELKYNEKYMICYCRYHHWLWHFKNGDNAAHFLKPKPKMESLLVPNHV